jgi:hypothetical protein
VAIVLAIFGIAKIAKFPDCLVKQNSSITGVKNLKTI